MKSGNTNYAGAKKKSKAWGKEKGARKGLLISVKRKHYKRDKAVAKRKMR